MDNASLEPRVMPFDLLQEITNGFSEERKLGSGSYGKVYMGVLKDGEKIAVKMLYDMPGLDDEQFQNEFRNLTRLQHQNIVRLVGYCRDIQEKQVEYNGKLVLAEKTYRALCLEYMSNGSLDKYLSDECDRYNWQTGYGIIKGICEGLKYLHKELKPPIYHLDLKPANVLLDKNMVPKIADFGLSRLFGEEQTRVTKSSIGTIGYLPPEYINTNLISNKFDIFSLGVVIIKIMAGRTGYSNSAEMSSEEFINLVYQNWRNRIHETLNVMELYSEQVKKCIKIALSCVQVDRHKRPTIEDIVDMLNETDTYASRNDSSLMYQDELLLQDGSYSYSSLKPCGPLMDYYIPDYVLKPECPQLIVDHAPCCPVVVFINSRSGRQLGSSLIKTYRELLNEAQVFDLSEEAPDMVLQRLYENFEKLKCNGDILAIQIQRSLRLIVAGGDGTANWLLGVVSDLRLSQPPPVATMPMGTQNNLPFSFGWGKKSPATDQEAVKSFLGLVKGAREMNIDSWHVIMRMRAPQEGPCDPIAPLELPHSLHAFHCVSGYDSLNVEGYHTFRGGFWNYFSMGMDAQVSYEFHSARKRNPEKVRNQGTYAKPGLKQGWFAASPSDPSSWMMGRFLRFLSDTELKEV